MVRSLAIPPFWLLCVAADWGILMAAAICRLYLHQSLQQRKTIRCCCCPAAWQVRGLSARLRRKAGMVREMSFGRTAITASSRGLAKALAGPVLWLPCSGYWPVWCSRCWLIMKMANNEIVGLRLGQIEIQQKPGLRLVVEMVQPVKPGCCCWTSPGGW